MPSKPLFLVAAACALPLTIAACGGGDSNDTIVPEGTHYGYVVSKAQVPTSPSQVTEFGLDLGSKTSSDLDGTPDNAIGGVLSTLKLVGFDVQTTIDTAINHGSIILLVDFQTKDFNNASASGLSVKIGANPNPPACTDANDMTCGHHLTGTGSFTIAPDSPTDALVAGKIENGTFTGGPGDVTLQIALGTPTPIRLDLLRARVRASTISESGIMTAKIGGLVTQEQLMTQIGPAIQSSVSAILAQNCTPGSPPPGCGCSGSTAALVLSLLDTSPKDCQVTTTEIFTSPTVAGVLQPDSCSKDSCDKPDSLAIGVQVQAVKATFPM